MNPRARIACLAADAARWGTTRLLHRGGGNAPGAVALRLDPSIIGALGDALERSVVVTGTNGKTTTTGLAADALGSRGEKVVCNRAGNNMESGIAAALVEARSERPRVGCFECDELYTVRVLPRLRPRALVLLNLFRDQLDRYGEIDHTQDVIAEALRRSPQTAIAYNADDPLCASIAARVDNPGVPFGIDEPTGLEADRISDSRFCAKCNAPLDYEYVHYGQLGKYRCPECGWERPELAFAAVNVSLTCGGYEFDIEDRRGEKPVRHHVTTRYNGLYMVYNVTAALVACLLGGGSAARFQEVLDAYEPASGRGKTYQLEGGYSVVSNLAKNPTGFNRMVQQVRAEDGRYLALFLNDNDADGHDVSWIWDIDLERLRDLSDLCCVCVGGTRREDMAVRVKYAELGAPIELINGVEDALRFVGAGEKLHVIANYTAFPPVVADLERLCNLGTCFSVQTKRDRSAAGDVNFVPGTKWALDRPLRIVHLYPDALNLYGDGGNIASLSKRCEWRGIPCRVDQVLMGQELDLSDADVVLLGGGADRDQLAVCHELQGQREKLAAYVEAGGVLLAICGGYQLLGHYYMMGDERVEGLHVLDIETTAGATRLIGNVAIESPVCDAPIVGFENHAGRTLLGAGEKPLGRALVHGTGNNGEDGGEGVLHEGVIGTYLHGPILPKNPGVTDWLLARALRRRGVTVGLPALNDDLELIAHDVAMRIATHR
ncbi:MurT ligase domain-containing protein [Thermophilibacter provencensis]|uniref:Multifunctional fusion protein n=1 Tax=Thermophilibacter provencensis TaxID=1852386 RepID=A0ABT7V2P5_9ACTN|nr:MurT ligase domain-containing protein [Thermophilibacter provencensis]MDM8270875.1 MurT ligase domain-containing protein [Thermophilibacter provencensis]